MDLNQEAGKWLDVSYQENAATGTIYSAEMDNTSGIMTEWKAIALAFAHQNANGSFDLAGTSQVALATEPSAEEFFVGYISEAVLAVDASSLPTAFISAFDELKPMIGQAGEYLASPANIALMEQADGTTANRIFGDAKALLLSGEVAGNVSVYNAGLQLLNYGLGMETPDGVFLENGGHDAGYQALSIMELTEIAILTNNPSAIAALGPAVAWEESRISPSGVINQTGDTRTDGEETFAGQPKGINYVEVSRGLGLYGAYANDQTASADALALVHQRVPDGLSFWK
jgi:hypothetical protein